MRLLGSASVKTTSMFITCVNEKNLKPLKSTSYNNSIVKHTRLMKGGRPVFKRVKKKPVLYMSQFRQPQVAQVIEMPGPVASEPKIIPNKLIKIRVTNMSETIIVDLVVKHCGELMEIATSYMLDLVLDPDSPTPQILGEIGITLRTCPVLRTRSASQIDPGFSGYTLMYALHNEGTHLDMMVEKDRSKLRSFIFSIASNAGSEINRQEFVITAEYLKMNPFTMEMPKTSCLWLLPTDIMLFDDAPRCIFWENASLQGDVIKTVIGLTTIDLLDIRNLPHVIVDNSEYGFLSLPCEIDPVNIINAINSCFLLILEDVIVGSEKDRYSTIFLDDEQL